MWVRLTFCARRTSSVSSRSMHSSATASDVCCVNCMYQPCTKHESWCRPGRESRGGSPGRLVVATVSVSGGSVADGRLLAGVTGRRPRLGALREERLDVADAPGCLSGYPNRAAQRWRTGSTPGRIRCMAAIPGPGHDQSAHEIPGQVAEQTQQGVGKRFPAVHCHVCHDSTSTGTACGARSSGTATSQSPWYIQVNEFYSCKPTSQRLWNLGSRPTAFSTARKRRPAQ